jgi:hypothetical protein
MGAERVEQSTTGEDHRVPTLADGKEVDPVGWNVGDALRVRWLVPVRFARDDLATGDCRDDSSVMGRLDIASTGATA